jgi:hypothetical protein
VRVASARVASARVASARVASARVAHGARRLSAGCIGARCTWCTSFKCGLHRRLLRRCGLHRCIGDAQPSRSETAVGCVAQCAARARLDWAKGGLCGGRAAVRCARAQVYAGGVLSMFKGTALFDAVAISDTGAGVRYWQFGDASRGRCALGRVLAYGMRGRFAAGVAGPAVRRRAMAAWCACIMGPSRSRAERSRAPSRCARCARTSHAANARA